jgi:hypothetical protein
VRKISIGVNQPGPLDLQATIDEARIADDLGAPDLRPGVLGRDARATALAGATSRVHWTTASSTSSRTPAALAQAFITLEMYFGPAW